MNFRSLLILILAYNYSVAQTPTARGMAHIAYDQKNQHIVLFGGSIGGGRIANDLWTLKGIEWKKLSDAGPKRTKSAFAYDAHRNRLVLFGGVGEDDVVLDETWEWDGKQWKQIKIPGPSARNHPMGIYDRKNKYVLIFGGFGNGLLSDTWAYDGKSWKQMDTNGPTDCLPHGIIYDEVRERVIMMSLALSPDSTDNMRRKNEMWEWSGSSWKKLPYSAPSTSSMSLQALASFGKDGIILFDGDDVSNHMGKTWKFSAGQWTPASLPGPSAPRITHSMVYDPSRKRTILFGGSDRTNVFNDLWEWDGKQWHDLTEQWLTTHPDDEKAWETYATSLTNTGKYSQAEEVYSKLLSKNPNNTNLTIKMVLLMYQINKPEEAKKYVSQAIKSNGLQKADFLNLGRSLYSLKNYAESARYYEEAAKINPEAGDFYNLACSYALGADKKNAFDALNKTVEMGFNSKSQYENDPDLESLRSDVRWGALLEKLK